MNIVGVKYPNINAKLRGMYSKRITKEDLEDLIKQPNLKTAISMLKSKNPLFKDVDENIDRLEIESLLEQSQIDDIKKIMKLLEKKDKEEFYIFLLQYEIKCVKSILRKLFAENKTNDIIVENVKRWTDELFDDIKGIQTVESFYEFSQAIKRMKYGKILNKYKGLEKANLFEIENTIDKTYFEHLYDIAGKNANFKKIVGSEIDLLNISWIYRLKKYYNFDKNSIINFLIKRYYKISKKTINQLIEANSYEEYSEALKQTKYKQIAQDEDYINQYVDKYLYKINKTVFKQDISTNAYIYAYINIIEYENNDIINTIEGLRYNVEKAEILKRLVY